MIKENVKVGQWVRFLTTDTKDQFTGFVLRKNAEYARIVIPSIQKTRSIPYQNLIRFDDEQFTLEDIESMQVLAVDTNDKEWFDELAEIRSVLLEWQ